ncbi:MAG: 5,6-dimethylbenzimidazole synthase [Alphaproteobacteria bacterium]
MTGGGTAKGAAAKAGDTPPRFDDDFAARLEELLIWRRDVRRFRPDPLPDGVLDELLRLMTLAPSVGNSQPWRLVTVDDPERRSAIAANFERCNRDALAGYAGSRRGRYARLKLQGLKEAPVHFAVFADHATEAGHGLGRRTMPETLDYSAVLAVHTLWLAARARGIGVGWLSILDPAAVASDLAVPEGWSFIAYLCLGYPLAEDPVPALERSGWQGREGLGGKVLRR